MLIWNDVINKATTFHDFFFLSPLADSDKENFVVLLKTKKLNSGELLGVNNFANQDILCV